MQEPDRSLAIRLRDSALERRGRLDDDGAIAFYRAARRADPGYFPALFEYISLMHEQFRSPELRREFPVADSTSGLLACLAAAAQIAADDERPIVRLLQLETRFGPSACTDAFLLQLGRYTPARGVRALRESPELRDLRSAVAAGMMSGGRYDEAEELLRSRGPALADPLASVQFAFGRVSVRLARKDSAGAAALMRSIGREARGDVKPVALARYLFAACAGAYTAPLTTRASRLAGCAELIQLVRRHRAGFAIWDATRRQAKELLESGAVAEAMPLLNQAVAIADSIGTPGLRLFSYTARGRAFRNLGRAALALRDLRLAVTFGPAAEAPYYHADAYHNLAHAYEGAGRLADAAFAADTFVMIADRLPNTSGRFMSRHDAGMIRWAAGWHAAAARDFEAMVDVIDAQNAGHFFAGEYFERVGQLGRAIEYYRAGAQAHATPDVRNFAALARVYEALGHSDSAVAIARRHDAGRDAWPLLERPLLPELLARRGRVGEAVTLADAWARRETAAGNVQGAANAWNHVAELHLMNRDWRGAASAATLADSLSRLLLLTAEGIAARTLRGRALAGQGLVAAGLAELRGAVRLATMHPSTTGLLSTNLALGNALELSSRGTEALRAYDRAATAVEAMTAGLDGDVNRAGFKARHLAPFDGAVRVLAGSAPSTAVAGPALEWSVRRKAAALALAGPRDRPRAWRVSASTLRGRLGPDEALIDFTVLDSSVTAIVARRSTIELVRLPILPDHLAKSVEMLRRPLVTTPGGRIDLAHARFDAVIAESLYAALIAPLEARLKGVSRLAIVPDGPLWYLPFAALISRRKSYLLEQYELRLLPSATFLDGDRSGSALPPGFRVDAFSHAVVGGSEEVSAIAAAIGAGRVRMYNGPTATERAALAATSDVLHIAAHGIVDDRDPLASHLRLAPAGRDDGLLHLAEVSAQKLAPRLVVLTACEGVSGKLYAGEGLVGLARAFLLSGARQVIASQWPVDASAARLAAILYRELERGHGAPTALRTAQLAMLRDPASAHPLHWAGFLAFEGRARQQQ